MGAGFVFTQFTATMYTLKLSTMVCSVVNASVNQLNYTLTMVQGSVA